MAPLRRVLVANRGEIARRIIVGAHDAGYEAVAVFAPDDARSPHVAEADLAIALTGATLGETYLNPEALVAAARAGGADALHPGYGFLSENPALPEACAAAGLTWVGPSAEAMRVMGHKTRAKETVAAAGVPVLPSQVLDATSTAKDTAAAAAAIGFPVLVKASAGGGGRGMRLVTAAGELAEAVASAQREAAAAFGSGEVFLERYLPSPRHIEVQVIGDTHGTVLHLFDRECSVQRRHQKVIEEAPAVLVPLSVRTRMWEAAIAAAASVGYVGVGTVEFLVDGEDFFFLEMNTRLQVEHGVTELVTGLDLVGLQLLVASGPPLPFAQAEVSCTGHAVEARLCAERPRENYQPTPGPVQYVAWPAGAGLRVDRAIESGSVVSPAYDSLVAKLMAHGGSRTEAITRLSRAVNELELDGLETNRELLAAVLTDDVYLSGDAGIDYLDSRTDLPQARLADEARRRQAAAASFALLAVRAARSLVPLRGAGWRNVGRAIAIDRFSDDDGIIEVRLAGPDGPAEVLVEGAWLAAGSAHVEDGAVDLSTDGVRRRYRVRLGAHHAYVNGPEGQSSFVRHSEDDADDRAGTAGECRAPLPGAVTKVLVAVGDTVVEGEGLVVLEAMKMEHTLRAGGPGTVTQILCQPNQQVDVGELLIALDPS
jgi:acetyl/propionyl-CoA carboxylase alpha subunit